MLYSNKKMIDFSKTFFLDNIHFYDKEELLMFIKGVEILLQTQMF